MKPSAETYGIDMDYLRRCKRSTPAQRLEWLAAALAFAESTRKAPGRKQARSRSFQGQVRRDLGM